MPFIWSANMLIFVLVDNFSRWEWSDVELNISVIVTGNSSENQKLDLLITTHFNRTVKHAFTFVKV
jgi:hypothetical protein